MSTLVRNPQSGEILEVQGDPAAYIEQGWTQPTAEQLQSSIQAEQYGTTGQQALGLGERVGRGLTLGQFQGVGTPEEIEARQEETAQQHPVLSAAADIAPMAAVGAVTGGLGEAAGLGRVGVLASEELGAGAVQAAQQAQTEGRQYMHQDIGADVENTMMWTGLGTVMGGVMGRTRPALEGAKGASARVMAEGELEDIAKREAAEHGPPPGALPSAEPPPLQLPPGASELALPEQGTPSPPGTIGLPEQPGIAARKGTIGEVEGPAVPQNALEQHWADYGKPKEHPPATPLESYLETLGDQPGDEGEGSSMRDQVENEIHDDVLDHFDNLGKRPPKEGSKAWREVEDQLVTERVAGEQGGAALEAPPSEPAPETPNPDPLQWGKPRGETAAEPLPEVPAPIAKIPRVVVDGVLEDAADDGLERALRNASASDAHDIVQRAVDEPGPAPEHAEERSIVRDRRLYANRVEILKTATDELQPQFTQAIRDMRAITDDKAELAGRNVSDNIVAQRALARDVVTQAGKFSGRLKAEAREYAAEQGSTGMAFPLPSAQKLTRLLMVHAEDIASATTGKEIFLRLNELKQGLDGIKVGLEQGKLAAPDPVHHNELIPRVEGFAHAVRAALEDRPTFGRAAEIQGAYNSLFTDKFFPSFRIFEEAVLKRTHRGYDAMWNTEGWESKIHALLEDADPGNTRHVHNMLGTMRDFADSRMKYGDDGDRVTAQRLIRRVDKIERTLKLGAEVQDATTRMQDVSKLAQAIPLIGSRVRAVLTGELDTPFKRLTEATEANVNRGVDDWIESSRARGNDGGGGRSGRGGRPPRGGASDGSGAAESAASGSRASTSGLANRPVTTRQRSPLEARFWKIARRHSVSLAMAHFMGDDDSPYKAFQRRRAALLDDQAFFDRIGGQFPTLQRFSPAALMLLSGRLAQARQFLLDRMPKNTGVSVMRPEGYPPNSDQIEDWALYWNAVTDPMRVVRNIASIRIQEIETLHTLYPRLWQQTQTQVITRMVAAQQSGHSLDDALLIRLDLIFGTDGLASPAFTMRAASSVKQIAPTNAPQGSSGKPSPDRLSPTSPALTGATMGTQG